MLILAFDTATDVATSALVSDGEVLGERASVAATLLEDVDALFRQASARGLALALGVEGAGVSTLDALAAGADGAVPVIDARRGEVFVPGPEARRPDDLEIAGKLCVGNGAIRYRTLLEARGGEVPPDGDPRHLPRAALHAALADAYGPVETIEPVYVREPDARPREA